MTHIKLNAIKHIDSVRYIDIDAIKLDYNVSKDELKAFLKIALGEYRFLIRGDDEYLHEADYYKLDEAIVKLRSCAPSEVRDKWFMQPSTYSGSVSGLYILTHRKQRFTLPVDDSLAAAIGDSPLRRVNDVLKIIPAPYKVAQLASMKHIGGEHGKTPYSRNFDNVVDNNQLIADCETAIATAAAELEADPDIEITWARNNGGSDDDSDDDNDDNDGQSGRPSECAHQ